MVAIALAIGIPLASAIFGGGIWFHRLESRLKRIENSQAALIFIHKKELIKYYLEKGIMPNPGMTPRKKYLLEKLDSGTMSFSEAQELSAMLKREEAEARQADNSDALMAILGLIALVAIIAALAKR